MKKWQKSQGNVFGTVQRKENCIWKTLNVWQILPSEGCRNEIIPVYLCVCHKMPSKWVKPLFNKALCCLRLKTVTQKRGGGEKKKNYLLLAETKADRTHTVGAGRNITAKCHRPGGSSPLIFPPFTSFPLVFSFPPRRFFSLFHCITFVPLSPPPPLCHAATLVTHLLPFAPWRSQFASVWHLQSSLPLRRGELWTKADTGKRREWGGHGTAERERVSEWVRERVSETEENGREREEIDDGCANVIWEMASLSRSD